MCIGCGDGTVRLFDRRLKPPDTRVATFREHSSWIVNAQLGIGGNSIISGRLDIWRFWMVLWRSALNVTIAIYVLRFKQNSLLQNLKNVLKEHSGIILAPFFCLFDCFFYYLIAKPTRLNSSLFYFVCSTTGDVRLFDTRAKTSTLAFQTSHGQGLKAMDAHPAADLFAWWVKISALLKWPFRYLYYFLGSWVR